MSGFQKIIVTGNLGQTPECRKTQSGDSVTNLSVAVNRVWYKKDDSEKQEEVTWYRVPLWREKAEDAEKYLVKGQEVTVCGRLVTDGFGNPPTWVDDAGQLHASFEICPTERIVYGPKPGGNGHRESEDRSTSRKSNSTRGNGSSRRQSAQRPRQTTATRQISKDSEAADAWDFS